MTKRHEVYIKRNSMNYQKMDSSHRICFLAKIESQLIVITYQSMRARHMVGSFSKTRLLAQQMGGRQVYIVAVSCAQDNIISTKNLLMDFVRASEVAVNRLTLQQLWLSRSKVVVLNTLLMETVKSLGAAEDKLTVSQSTVVVLNTAHMRYRNSGC